jgi:hypothetical protein
MRIRFRVTLLGVLCVRCYATRMSRRLAGIGYTGYAFAFRGTCAGGGARGGNPRYIYVYAFCLVTYMYSNLCINITPPLFWETVSLKMNRGGLCKKRVSGKGFFNKNSI